MLDSTTGILLTALLVIPTCLGLWRGDSNLSTGDPEKMKRLLNRRMAHRRRATRTGKNPRVNYFFLETQDPAQSYGPEDPEGRWDRRTRGRRAEDTARGSAIIEPAIVDGRASPAKTQQTLSAGAAADVLPTTIHRDNIVSPINVSPIDRRGPA